MTDGITLKIFFQTVELSLIIKAGLRISLSGEKNIGLMIIWGDVDSKITVK